MGSQGKRVNLVFQLVSNEPVTLYECESVNDDEIDDETLCTLNERATEHHCSVLVGGFLVVRNLQKEARIRVGVDRNNDLGESDVVFNSMHVNQIGGELVFAPRNTEDGTDTFYDVNLGYFGHD